MKIATVDAEFRELKGENRVVGHGEGSTVRAAISRAIADIFKNTMLERKRITTINMTVTLNKKTNTEDE